MEACAHEARMNARLPDGSTQRELFQRQADKGMASAIVALKGPEVPEGFEYLYGWAHELYGRSGAGMDGVVPLTYATIEYWRRLTGNRPRPREVRALLVLDGALRPPALSHPAKGKRPKGEFRVLRSDKRHKTTHPNWPVKVA